MKKVGWLAFLALTTVVLSLFLSGCVNLNPPSTMGNPYFPISSTRYDKVKITVPFFMAGVQETQSVKNSSTILNATVSCVEDAKYTINEVGNGKKEFKMIFSNAWEGKPDQEGDMGLLYFTLDKDSVLYLFDSNLKLIDGPNGNLVGSIDMHMGTETVVRTSSRVNLNFDGKSYTNVLKVSLYFPDYTFNSISAALTMDFYFAKNVGLVQFTIKMNYSGENISAFDVKVIETNVPSYEVGPSAATSLSPNNNVVSIPSNVILTWQNSQSNVSYTIFVYDSDGNLITQRTTSSKSCDIGTLQNGMYFWIVRTENSDGLSTLSKTAVFTIY